MGASTPRAPITRPSQAEPVYKSDRDRYIESLTAASSHDAERISKLSENQAGGFFIGGIICILISLFGAAVCVEFKQVKERLLRLEKIVGMDEIGRRK